MIVILQKTTGPVTYAAMGMLRRSDPDRYWHKYKIKKIIMHPLYRSPSKYNDIALLKTEERYWTYRSQLHLCFITPLKMLAYGCVALLIAMASGSRVPKIPMNDGREMPAIALGTFLGVGQDGLLKPEEKQVRDAVVKAIDIGYRHIDTAAIYQTEDQVGEAVRAKIAEGVVKREDIFITTKLWNTHHKREQVAEALKRSLEQLGLNYVDLYLIHWPMGLNEDYTYSDVDYMETWRGMEDVQRLGLAKSIGVSNFNVEQMKRLLKEGTVKPAALQIEVHPHIIQAELISLCQAHNIVVMGYSPLGTLVARFGAMFPGPKMDDPLLVEIAKKYGKTTAQVVLRWAVDRKVVPLPKSVNPKRIKENIDIFDFKLTEDEIKCINSFNADAQVILPSFWQEHKYYPFKRVENPIADPFLAKAKAN